VLFCQAAKAEEVVGQPVRPALPPSAYVSLLRRNLLPALETLRSLASSEDYAGLSASLFLSPFDDLRQAAYFLPWAILPRDEQTATHLQELYLVVRSRWMGIDEAAIAASRGKESASGVAAAVDGFAAAIDAFYNAVPSEYIKQ
jgi:hypothetical protein